jgi:hypothetical protein
MIEITENEGAIRHYSNGELHRANGPALTWDDGEWSWALYDRMHRYYGPVDNFYGHGRWVIHGTAVRRVNDRRN